MTLWHSSWVRRLFMNICPLGAPCTTLSLPGLSQPCPLHSAEMTRRVNRPWAVANITLGPFLLLWVVPYG
jgi:hypothetical protein